MQGLACSVVEVCEACLSGSVSTGTAMKVIVGLGDAGDKKVNMAMNALLIALTSACTGAGAEGSTDIYTALCDKCDAAKILL